MSVASRRPASPVSGLRIPVGPLGGFFRRLIAVYEFALAMARMSALTASGNVGQAAITTSRSGPISLDCAAGVPARPEVHRLLCASALLADSPGIDGGLARPPRGRTYAPAAHCNVIPLEISNLLLSGGIAYSVGESRCLRYNPWLTH
jgi:hypothetical protein